jgi:hypothetical protein
MLLPVLLLAMAAFEEPAMVRAAPITPAEKIDEDVLRQLLMVRRVFVDRLSGGETATQMRDMIVSSLQNAKLFVITENQERADAVLRGSAEDLVFTDEHSSSDSVHAQANFGLGGSGTSNSRTVTRGPRSQNGGMSVGDSESSRSTERKHEAVAAVRLVNKEGDVIWSTTQESIGGKFRGSSADVADRITKKLLEDYDRAKKLPK